MSRLDSIFGMVISILTIIVALSPTYGANILLMTLAEVCFIFFTVKFFKSK